MQNSRSSISKIGIRGAFLGMVEFSISHSATRCPAFPKNRPHPLRAQSISAMMPGPDSRGLTGVRPCDGTYGVLNAARDVMSRDLRYIPEQRVVLIVGNYGSGKTEVAVNLAIQLRQTQSVAIADLDIVNPYFRCREARKEMESHGVRVINPDGEFQAADLPIILPELRGALIKGEDTLIFDVGGDDVGARVLSSLADIFDEVPYAMLQVLNAKRPFTEDVPGCLRIQKEIEAASRLNVTGLISNTHLQDETTVETIQDGLRLAEAVENSAGQPIAFVTVNENLRAEFDPAEANCPILWIERRMLPPWKLRRMADRAMNVLGRDPDRKRP